MVTQWSVGLLIHDSESENHAGEKRKYKKYGPSPDLFSPLYSPQSLSFIKSVASSFLKLFSLPYTSLSSPPTLLGITFSTNALISSQPRNPEIDLYTISP